jgi:gas vesicle protein
MSDDPDVIRANIEVTRAELGGDVDALADKVTPSKIADRQMNKVRGAFTSVKEKFMGSDDEYDGHRSVTEAAGDTLEDARDATMDAGRTVVRKAQGNPMAVGLIAFGVGLLTASLIPPSDAERKLAASAKDAAQPVIDEVSHAGQEAAQHLKQPAQDAVPAVKETAQDSAENVKSVATDRTNDVMDDAKDASHRFQDGS